MPEHIPFVYGFGRGLNRVLQFAGSMVLAAMMFLGAADVILRYFFNNPIDGTYELIEYMMAVIIPLALCVCAHQKAHICVDIITAKLPGRSKSTLTFLGDLVSTFFAAVMAWRCFFYIGEEFESQMTSSVLFIPVWPFIAIVFIGLTSLSLIWLVNLLHSYKEMVRKWSQS